MLVLTAVVALFHYCVDLHIASAIGSQHNANCLFPCPELYWFQNGWRGKLDTLVAVVEVPTHLHDLRTIQKFVFLGQ